MRSPRPASAVPLLLTLIVLATGTAAVEASAQAPAEGETIRVTVADWTAIYEFREIRGDTLLAASPDATLRIPLATLVRLEVGTPAQIDRTRRTIRYALVGAGIGLIVGGIVGGASTASDEICESTFCGLPNMEPAVDGMAYGGMVGGAIGALVGLLSHPGWSWRVVDTDALVVGVGATRGVGFGLVLSREPGSRARSR